MYGGLSNGGSPPVHAASPLTTLTVPLPVATVRLGVGVKVGVGVNGGVDGGEAPGDLLGVAVGVTVGVTVGVGVLVGVTVGVGVLVGLTDVLGVLVGPQFVQLGVQAGEALGVADGAIAVKVKPVIPQLNKEVVIPVIPQSTICTSTFFASEYAQ